MGPHQGTVEGEKNLPRLAGHTPLNAPQDSIGLLGSQGTLLAHGQPVVHQHSQVPLPRAALQQVRLKPVLVQVLLGRARMAGSELGTATGSSTPGLVSETLPETKEDHFSGENGARLERSCSYSNSADG